MRGYMQALEAARYAASDHGPHRQAPQDDRTPSCLATALLLLWAQGGSSATAVQHLAVQAVLDGVHHQEVTELAGLGAFGAHKGNIGRDIMRLMEFEHQNTEASGNVSAHARHENKPGARSCCSLL